MTDFTINFQGHDVQLSDVDYSPGQQAYTSGLPEDCYPAESPEISFKIDTGNDLLDQLLDENHIEEITELAFQTIEEQAKADVMEK